MAGGWVKTKSIGSGSRGEVSLAIKEGHAPMAVKSANWQESYSIQEEAKILSIFRDCPHIITCYGQDISVENREKKFNLLLEYAPGGSLEDLRICRGSLPENAVRKYTYMILKGLAHMHDKNYVHCDIKPHNILVFPSSDTNIVKIADFGLAKLKDEKVRRFGGTAMFMSPEVVAEEMSESPRDIWALACTVVEIISGNTVWSERYDKKELLSKIGNGHEVPYIPENMSAVGKDFLRLCFERDPMKRPTARKLLQHEFVLKAANDPSLLLGGLPRFLGIETAVERPSWIIGEGMFDREQGFLRLSLEKLLTCLKGFLRFIFQ